MPAQKLKDYLNANHVRYLSIPHFSAYTAQEIAAAAHVPGRELAKTVVAKLDGCLAMVILPATKKLNVDLLKEASGCGLAEMATEREFKDLFPDCELGAMPPFGNLYDMPVYVDFSLAQDEQIAFNAGTHEELIRMSYQDFVKLVRPVVADLSSYRPKQLV